VVVEEPQSHQAHLKVLEIQVDLVVEQVMEVVEHNQEDLEIHLLLVRLKVIMVLLL
tara:strand:+ start:220 stop:387 length:168 start_codon:yes stop_codon:yes gene_type:complete